MIAIGINKDSDGFTVAMGAVSTVHRPWLPSGDDDEKSDLSPVASSLLIVMDNTATFRLFPASILHIEGLVWLLQRQRVVRRFYDNFLCTIRIFLHPYEVDLGPYHNCIGMYQRQPCITQQSTGLGVRFTCLVDRVGSFIRGIMPDFHIWCTKKMGWIFT